MSHVAFTRPARSRRAVRAALATGTLAMATTAAQVVVAGPVLSAPMQLVNSEAALQPVVDQLLQVQQQVEDQTADFPFVRPSDLGAMLHEYSQNFLSTLLASQIPALNFTQFHDVGVPHAPYPWDAPATNMQQFLTLANPDDQYGVLPVAPDHTYVITVDPHPGTQDLTFDVNSGDGVTVDYHPLRGLNLDDATPNPDGSYTIVMSSTQPADTPAGNWVDTAGGDRVIVRDTVGDWGQLHDNLAIQEVGLPSTNTIPVLSQDQIATLLTTVADNALRENASPTYFGQMDVPQSLPENTFSPIQPTVPFMPGPLLPGTNQISSLGNFDLQPDQALVVKVPDIDSGYSSAMVSNTFGQTAAPVTATGSLNDTQAFHDPDGYTYYVISSQDPGVANWINDGGVAHGEVWLRWQGITGALPTTAVQADVVNVADVRNEVGNLLPADTPIVTAAERAADLQDRLFEWDYTHDQDMNNAWIAGNLEIDQIKAAVGADQFDKLFGGQGTVFGVPQHVPSILDRLTPALSPSMGTLAHDILTDPSASLAAIKDNLPLLENDIALPLKLALARVEEVFQMGTGLQGLETVFNETFTDPVTSITAGILNARDDLTVAVMNATDGFPSQLGPVAALQWQDLLQPGTALADLGTLLNSAMSDLGSDIAPLGW